MKKNYDNELKNLVEMRKRLASAKLEPADISALDQMIVGHIELHKSLSAATEKIGDKVVLAKLPFGVDLVK